MERGEEAGGAMEHLRRCDRIGNRGAYRGEGAGAGGEGAGRRAWGEGQRILLRPWVVGFRT